MMFWVLRDRRIRPATHLLREPYRLQACSSSNGCTSITWHRSTGAFIILVTMQCLRHIKRHLRPRGRSRRVRLAALLLVVLASFAADRDRMPGRFGAGIRAGVANAARDGYQA